MSKIIQESGTRKTATARATLRAGRGMVRVNNQLPSSISNPVAREKILEPIRLASDVVRRVDIDVNVNGGGTNSQAEACRVAISRVLVAFDKKLEKRLLDYDRHLLVPDVRQKETHKPNHHGKARAKTQTSYR